MPTANGELGVGDHRPCEHCSGPILLRIKRDIVRKKFCSPSCRQKGRWARGEMREQLFKAQSAATGTDKTPTQKKRCDSCGKQYLPINGRQRWCSVCAPDKTASGRLQRYGVSQPVFDSILERQGGGCKLCGSDKALVVDHDHECCEGTVTCGNCVRGILCQNCNFKLAVLEADPAWVAAAIRYLGEV